MSEGDAHHRNVRRFRGGLAFKAHRLCVSLNSRLESTKEEEERVSERVAPIPQRGDFTSYRGTSLIRNRPPHRNAIGA